MLTRLSSASPPPPFGPPPPVGSPPRQRPLFHASVFDSAKPGSPPSFLSEFTDRRCFYIGWRHQKRSFYTTAFSIPEPAFAKPTNTRRSPSVPAVRPCPRPAEKSLERSSSLSIICEICAICGPFLSPNVRFSRTTVFDSAGPHRLPSFLSKFTDRRHFRIGWTLRKQRFYTNRLAPPKTWFRPPSACSSRLPLLCRPGRPRVRSHLLTSSLRKPPAACRARIGSARLAEAGQSRYPEQSPRRSQTCRPLSRQWPEFPNDEIHRRSTC